MKDELNVSISINDIDVFSMPVMPIEGNQVGNDFDTLGRG